VFIYLTVVYLILHNILHTNAGLNMLRFSILFFYCILFSSGKLYAQQKEDFVMYAKDSSVEINRQFVASPIPDSINLAPEKLAKLNLLLNAHLNKLNTVLSEQDLTDKQKKDRIQSVELDFLICITESLSSEEYRKFENWYVQTFKYPTN
jgi:hypothetical protein